MQQSKNQPADIEVALWQYSQDEHDWGRWMRSLSQDELERAAAYRFDRDRVAFIAGRFLLRRLLSAHTGTLPREIMLVADAQGKPSLEGRGVPQFSLANADGLVTVAVASSCDRVGIDCERAGAEIEEAALDAYCSLNERRWLDEMPARERAHAAIQLWALKESHLKALGVGLREDPRNVTFSWEDGFAFCIPDQVARDKDLCRQRKQNGSRSLRAPPLATRRSALASGTAQIELFRCRFPLPVSNGKMP